MRPHLNRSVPLAVAVLALALGGCVDSGRDPNATVGEDSKPCPWEPDTSVDASVDIGWQASPTGDLVVKDLGLLEACMPNATITWSQFSSGADVVQAFGSDGIDLGMLGSSPASTALSEPLRLPIEVVWIQEVIGEAEALVVRDPAVKSVEDLAGKKVAVPFSSTAHFSLLQALEGAGLVAGKDVELVNLAPEAMAGAWEGDQIDAAWIWNPVLGELQQSGQQIYSSADTAKAGKPTYDLSAATVAFADDNPEFMKQWATAQDYAVQMIADDPEAAAESIAIQMGVSPNEVSDLFSGYEYLPAKEQATDDWLAAKVAKDLRTTAGFLLEQGAIEGVSSESTYRAGVDPGPASTVGE